VSQSVIRHGAFGLSYGLVLGFVNLSLFLWFYYWQFDRLSDRFDDKLKKRKFIKNALNSLNGNKNHP
jgi:uncharacterized membrane protein YbaN (DUF454 family)